MYIHVHVSVHQFWLYYMYMYICIFIYVCTCMYMWPHMCTPVFPSNKFLKFEIEIFSNFFSKY